MDGNRSTDRNRGGFRSVFFPSRGPDPIQLEGLFHASEGEGPWPAAVVCHPHPLGGGSMLNGVVAAMTRALAARDVLALRFNFRGVNRSGGRYDGGRGEQSDVAGALDWLLARPEVDPERVSVVGYSFGAWVGLSYAQTDPRVVAVAAAGLVAWREDALSSPGTAFNLSRFEPGFLQVFRRPKLFVSGEHDGFVSPQALRGLVDRLPPPKQLHVLPGTDHFFAGREREVGELVAGFVVGL